MTGPGSAPQFVLVCTVRRHPDGGWTAVLHPSSQPAPVPTDRSISLPNVDYAVAYARNHYGTVPLVVDHAPTHPKAA